ncbi:MAG: HAD family hydrolase [Chloroflexota bacterium]
MDIQALIFDIGGVLVRTVDRSPRTALARRLGMTYEALEELVFGGESGRRAQRGEISAQEQWAHVCRQLEWPLDRWLALQQEFFAGDRLDTELIDDIRTWRRRYKTGIISNALSDVRATIASQWHFEDAFDVIVTSAEVGVMKPDARIFQVALQALAVQPQQAVFIDDFPRNVEGAKVIGMQAIHFRNPGQVKDELRQLLTWL